MAAKKRGPKPRGNGKREPTTVKFDPLVYRDLKRYAHWSRRKRTEIIETLVVAFLKREKRKAGGEDLFKPLPDEKKEDPE